MYPFNEGAHLIESILATWVDLLIARQGRDIPERVRQYVTGRAIPSAWRDLAPVESHWRIIYAQFHMRMLRLRIRHDDSYYESPPMMPVPSANEIAEKIVRLAAYLNGLAIEDALDWLEALAYSWAAGYDRAVLRHELKQMGEFPDSAESEKVKHYPIGLLANLTEA